MCFTSSSPFNFLSLYLYPPERPSRIPPEIDTFTTSNGSINIIMLKHMKMLRNNAIVGNIEHFDHEIFMVTFESMQGVKCQNVESQVDR